ncbi:MAG: hypothetical protein FJY29_12540 [Betaproteobacteria bacterium]|nr:hypothetical protein [Betaproteobacteria bacterium]
MRSNKVFDAGSNARRRAVHARSTAWWKSLLLANGAFLIAVSCSNASQSLTVPGSFDGKNSKSIAGAGADASQVSGSVELGLTPLDVAGSPLDLIKGFNHIAFVERELLVGSSTIAAGAIPLAKGLFGAPAPLPLPPFASGKAYLPLRADGSEFWLVESPEGRTILTRSLEAAVLPLGQTLPKNVKITIDSPTSLIGFGKNFVMFVSSNSLWIAEFAAGKLKASSVPLPNSDFKPVSAGALGEAARSFWIAESDTIWTVVGSADEWKAKKFELNGKAGSFALEKFAALVELSQGSPKLAGAAVAVMNAKIYSAGVTLPQTPSTLPSPVASAPPMPNVGAMTFAEARALCDSCHATSSSNTPAKAKLTGTENITTWVNRKEAIINSVRDDVMPLGTRLTEPNKTRFLNFAQDPKL